MAVKDQVQTKDYCLYCGDCCEVLPDLPDDSVGLSIFSPPFASLYSYSDDPRDMGNSRSRSEFFKHFQFMVEHLHRVLIPGRIIAVHCMDLPSFKKSGEEIGIWDFPGHIVTLFQNTGFTFHARVCIWKDPLIAATRTKSIQLAHKQIVKDSSMCGIGIADYVLAFRKPGENPRPIENQDGLTTYCGSRSIPKHLDKWIGYKGHQGKNKRSQWIWQQYASPVWFDIRQTYVLPYRKARDGDDEKHICPLQLDVIERCMSLWSAPGDVVLTPFMGVGSEVYVAVKNRRKGIGIELKPSYYRQAVRNVQSIVRKREARKLT